MDLGVLERLNLGYGGGCDNKPVQSVLSIGFSYEDTRVEVDNALSDVVFGFNVYSLFFVPAL